MFAKLYANSHVRADRWYKLGRMILYGALEDETSFQNLRRFVQYEDYTLRLMQDVTLPVPAPYGIVEMTPEREYLIVMEFVDGAVEISQAQVDDGIIDEGQLLVRKLWYAGLAHRDIKPGNLMVRAGRVLLVDAFFVQVRPSPWRQAADLGNMMLVLAVQRWSVRRVVLAVGLLGFAAARGRLHLRHPDAVARRRDLGPAGVHPAVDHRARGPGLPALRPAAAGRGPRAVIDRNLGARKTRLVHIMCYFTRGPGEPRLCTIR